jgi:regulator of replication initiation timing
MKWLTGILLFLGIPAAIAQQDTQNPQTEKAIESLGAENALLKIQLATLQDRVNHYIEQQKKEKDAAATAKEAAAKKIMDEKVAKEAADKAKAVALAPQAK